MPMPLASVVESLARLAAPWKDLYDDNSALSVAVIFLHLAPLLVGGGLAIAARLRHGARIVSYAPPEFSLSGSRPVSADTLAELGTLLKSVTRTAWKVSIVDAPGEPTLREAQDAAELIEVEYEPLSALTDFVAAMDPDAPLVHAEWSSYERDDQMVADGNTISYATIVKGDADAAMNRRLAMLLEAVTARGD